MNTPQGILILGGAGFVGRHLLKRLTGNHPEIYVISRHADLFPTKLAGLQCYADSLDNLELLATLLPRCQTVIHLASSSTPGSTASQPTFEVVNNLLPTLRFLEVLQKYEHVSLIYLSSGGAIYGNATAPLVAEETLLTPLSYYGAGKAAIETFILTFCQQAQRPAIILRPANFYGPEQPHRQGFGIVSTIFHLLQSQQPLEIWGDGEVVRDYLYIDDFIDLCVQLLASPFQHQGAKIYNVGSEQGTTLNQLCTLIEQVTQTTIQRHYRPSRKVDVKRIVLNCARLHEDYSWYPRTDLLTGLTATWQWYNGNQVVSSS
jgi:UDP-glucose 4-epimerase